MCSVYSTREMVSKAVSGISIAVGVLACGPYHVQAHGSGNSRLKFNTI